MFEEQMIRGRFYTSRRKVAEEDEAMRTRIELAVHYYVHGRCAPPRGANSGREMQERARATYACFVRIRLVGRESRGSASTREIVTAGAREAKSGHS